MKPLKNLIAAGIALLATTSFSQAAVILNWVNWTNPGSYPNSAVRPGFSNYNYATGTTGTIQLPDTTNVNVTMSGEIMSPDASAFGTVNNSFWSTENYNSDTFISANVPSLPTNSDRIAVGGYGVAAQTLTFSQPVSNIVMNVWSMGNPSTINSYAFNQPFAILSDNAGQYTRAPWNAPYALQKSGNTLSGYEGSGTIQFTGTFSSLSWTITNPEYFSVWNIGVTSASAPSAVPEPGQVAASLLLLGGIGAFLVVKRRKALKKAISMA